jgi:hypothetical protein
MYIARCYDRPCNSPSAQEKSRKGFPRLQLTLEGEVAAHAPTI